MAQYKIKDADILDGIVTFIIFYKYLNVVDDIRI
jgi:hypothetical protein